MEKLVVLGQWEKAKQAIAQCHSIDEVKQIRDQAEALRAYVKQAKEGLEVQNKVCEIKLRAERRIGEFSKELPKNPQFSKAVSHDGKPFKMDILKEADISHYERYEAIASVPGDKFEEFITNTIKSNMELTTANTIRLAKELEKEKRIEREKDLRTDCISEIEIRKGDFQNVLADIYDIDAIITDPPYPAEYLNCFSQLSLYASEHLKEDGFCVAYSGQYHLPEVINRLSEHLTYVWTFCLYHVGKKQLVNGVNIMCGWKPVLVFSKGRKKMRYSAYDVLTSEAMEKMSHEWQQSESGVAGLIEIFTEPGQLVVDPFSGSGTFVKVAKDMGRKAIGAELK